MNILWRDSEEIVKNNVRLPNEKKKVEIFTETARYYYKFYGTFD